LCERLNLRLIARVTRCMTREEGAAPTVGPRPPRRSHCRRPGLADGPAAAGRRARRHDRRHRARAPHRRRRSRWV